MDSHIVKRTLDGESKVNRVIMERSMNQIGESRVDYLARQR